MNPTVHHDVDLRAVVTDDGPIYEIGLDFGSVAKQGRIYRGRQTLWWSHSVALIVCWTFRI